MWHEFGGVAFLQRGFVSPKMSTAVRTRNRALTSCPGRAKRHPGHERYTTRAKSRLAHEPLAVAVFTMSNSYVSSFPRRVAASGFCPCDRVHPRMEGWAERRQAHYFCCRVSETRRVRTQRGAARPMTRDARLSALHRGDFRPGAALPSPALPPDPYSDAPRSQVVMPGGRCPGPPEPAVTSRGRRTPLPAPPTGPSPEDAPP